MYPIQTNQSTAARRRVFFPVLADVNATPYAGSVTGVTANLSLNGGTENATIGPTADIVRAGGMLHYVELSQAQVNQAVGTVILGRIPAASGRLESVFSVLITEYDPADAPTAAEIATAVAAPSAAAIASATETALADNISAVGTAVAGVAAAVDTIVANDFAAIPAAVVAAMRAEETSSAWGVQTAPSGGSAVVWPERRAGTLIGNRTVYYTGPSGTGDVVGMSAVVAP